MMGTELRWLAGLLGVVQVLGWTQASSLAAQVVAPTVAQPVLRVGMSGDYPPFASRDAEGTLGGFELFVAERLGRDLQVQVQVVPFTWPTLAAELNKGAFDIAMSGVTLRADRALEMRFTRPYAVGGAVAVIRKSDAERFAKIDDFDRKGLPIGVNGGGHLERVARARFPQANLVTIDDNTELLQRLLDKTCDAVVSDSFEAATWPAKEIVVRGPFTRDHKAYALRPSAAGLLRQVNDWLAAREADGWLDEQRRRHLGEAATSSARQAASEAVLAAIRLRLQLMPYVAAVKRRDGLPIEDPAQEKRVREQVRDRATSLGLDPAAAIQLFEALMAAAKAVEHATTTPPPAAALRLAALRQTIAAASDQILAELARLKQIEAKPASSKGVQSLLAEQLRRDGLSAALADRIASSASQASKP